MWSNEACPRPNTTEELRSEGENTQPDGAQPGDQPSQEELGRNRRLRCRKCGSNPELKTQRRSRSRTHSEKQHRSCSHTEAEAQHQSRCSTDAETQHKYGSHTYLLQNLNYSKHQTPDKAKASTQTHDRTHGTWNRGPASSRPRDRSTKNNNNVLIVLWTLISLSRLHA